MSRLRIFSESDSHNALLETTEHAAIARALADVGVRFERWQTTEAIIPGASQEAVIAAYRADIQRLKDEKGYQAVDVVSLTPDHPDRETLRKKFLSEHTHSEDEVRFFVSGAGLFSLHMGTRIFEILCTQGDLISVPDNTRHWFDMGPTPSFVAIRLFSNPAGWVANFTGDPIANRYPRLDSSDANAAQAKKRA